MKSAVDTFRAVLNMLGWKVAPEKHQVAALVFNSLGVQFDCTRLRHGLKGLIVGPKPGRRETIIKAIDEVRRDEVLHGSSYLCSVFFLAMEN